MIENNFLQEQIRIYNQMLEKRTFFFFISSPWGKSLVESFFFGISHLPTVCVNFYLLVPWINLWPWCCMCCKSYWCLTHEPWALAGVAPWIECQPVNWKVANSSPSQGTFLGCKPGPQLGVCKKQLIISLTHWCFSPSVPSFLPPLSKNK